MCVGQVFSPSPLDPKNCARPSRALPPAERRRKLRSEHRDWRRGIAPFHFCHHHRLSQRMKKLPIILLIEDHESDAAQFRRALKALSFRGDLRVAVNAWDARDHLEGRGTFASQLD